MALTSQQEAFAQAVASGKSQAEAYRIAYPKNRKPERAWELASRLMANCNVSARVDSIRAELAERGLWTREDSVRILSEIATDDDASNKDRTGAIKELNAMHGFNAPQKIEHSGAMPVTLVVNGVKPDA